MSEVHVFVSFDVENDEDLYERLLAQSKASGSGFAVSSSSRHSTAESASEIVRRRIRAADQMIVLCGEKTGSSPAVGTELAIAREENTPYILLWGRRDSMCTKPDGTRPAEGIYSWTRQILQEQIAAASRKTATDAAAAAVRKARQER